MEGTLSSDTETQNFKLALMVLGLTLFIFSHRVPFFAFQNSSVYPMPLYFGSMQSAFDFDFTEGYSEEIASSLRRD